MPCGRGQIVRQRLELVVLLTWLGHADVRVCIALAAICVVVRAMHVMGVTGMLAVVMTVNFLAGCDDGLRYQCRRFIVVF
jgi:hypothetical protein